MELSPNGERAISWSEGRQVTLWDRESGAALDYFDGYRARFSPDGDRFVYIDGGRAVVRDAASGDFRWETATQAGEYEITAWSQDGRFLTATSRLASAQVWDGETGRHLHSLPATRGAGSRFPAFSPDGRLLAVTDFEGRIHVYATATGRVVNILTGHQLQTGLVAWSPDSRKLLSISMDSTARVWPAEESLIRETVAQHQREVLDVGYHEDSELAASIGRDHTLVLVREDSDTPERRVSLFSPALMRNLVLHPGGEDVAATLDTNVPMVLDAASGEIRHTLKGHRGQVMVLSYSRDGTRLLAGGRDGALHQWDANTGEEIRSWSTGYYPVHDISWHPDGGLIASATSRGELRLWNAEDGTPVQVIHATGSTQRCLFLDDGRRLVAVHDNGLLEVWDLSTGEIVESLRQRDSSVFNVAAAPGSDRILLATLASGLRILRTDNASTLAFFDAGPESLRGLVWPRTGTAVLAGDSQGKVIRFHAVDWQAERTRTDAVHAAIESSESRFRAERHGRYLAKREDTSPPWLIYAPAPALAEELAALLRAGDNADESGLPIVSRRAIERGAPLALLAGDRIVSVAGHRLATAEGRDRAALAAAEAANSFERLDAVIVRDGVSYSAAFQALAVEELVETLEVPRERLGTLIAAQLELLENQWEYLVQVSRDVANMRGIRLRGDQIHGHVLLTPADDDMGQYYREFRLAAGDRVHTVDGTPVTAARQYAELVRDLQERYEAGALDALEIQVERGALQQVTVQITVQEP